MQECKLVKVLIHVGVKLSANQYPKAQEDVEDMSFVLYASVVGSLMYAMAYTRPSIANAMGALSKYMSKPGKEQWTTAKKVFKYQRGTLDYAICYQGRPRPQREGYMALLAHIGLEILTIEDLKVVMFLNYFIEILVGIRKRQVVVARCTINYKS